MVIIEAKGSITQVRSFLEGIAGAAGDSANTANAAARYRVKVRANVFDNRLSAKLGKVSVSLTFYENTGNIQLQTVAELEDQMKTCVQDLEHAYHTLVTTGRMAPVPPGSTMVTNSFRNPPMCTTPSSSSSPNSTPMLCSSSFLFLAALMLLHSVFFASSPVQASVPSDRQFRAAIVSIAEFSKSSLAKYPEWQTKLLQILEADFGLGMNDA